MTGVAAPTVPRLCQVLTGRLRLRQPMALFAGRQCADVFSETEVSLLRGWGLVPERDGAVQWPGDGTLSALCDHAEPLAFGDGTPAELELFRHIHQACCVGRRRACDAVILKLAKMTGGQVLTEDFTKRVLGKAAGTGAAKRACELQGRGRGRKAYSFAGRADLEDLLEEFPEEARAPIRSALSKDVLPKIVPPDPAHIARVKRIVGRPARVLAACRVLQPAIDRRTKDSAYHNLQRVERFDDMVEEADQRCGMAVSKAWRDYAAGVLRPTDREPIRLKTAEGYNTDHRLAAEWAEATLGPAAEAVIALLPARHDDAAGFECGLRERLRELSAAAATEKEAAIVALAPYVPDLLQACENRAGQLQGLVNAYLEELERRGFAMASGAAAGFRWKGPVVRPDGSLGVGEQEVRMQMVREDDLVRQAAARDPGNSALAWLVERVEADPKRADRIHVVYDGVSSTTPGGERHEPWFVDLFRCGVFGSPIRLSRPLAARRASLLARMGRPKGFHGVAGMLDSNGSRRDAVDDCRRSDPYGACVVIPLLEILHAMLCARIVLRMGIRWGARIGETKQIQSGCVYVEKVGGRPKKFARLKPKGWADDGIFGIDDGTVLALAQLKLIAHHRWFPDCFDAKGKPDVPVSAYADTARTDLEPDRYLLRSESGALRSFDLLNFVRVLLSGVADLSSHDGRYLFATALGLDGSDYGTIGAALHHSPESSMPKKYDLSRYVLMKTGTAMFNAQMEVGMLGRALNA